MADTDVQAGADLVEELAGIAPADDLAGDAPVEGAFAADLPAEPGDDESFAEPEPTPVDLLRAQFAAAEERAKRLEREIEFIRAQAPQAPAEPMPQAPSPVEQIQQALNVSEDDLAELLAGGPRAAGIATMALQRAAALGAQVALQQAAVAYTQDQTQRAHLIAQQQSAERMKHDFWSSNADLEAYAPLVQHFAREVAAEQPTRQFDWQGASAEVAQRTRGYLAKLGVVQAPTQGQPAVTRTQRVRPAFGESGSRGASSARPMATQFQEQFGDLISDMLQ